MSFFDGRWPRWRVTFEGAVWPAAPALGFAAAGREIGAPLDIDDGFSVVNLINPDSSSDGEGVGGKYSKLGESKPRAREAIERDEERVRVMMGSSPEQGSYICARERGGGNNRRG
jgi:hypothetical protein